MKGRSEQGSREPSQGRRARTGEGAAGHAEDEGSPPATEDPPCQARLPAPKMMVTSKSLGPQHSQLLQRAATTAGRACSGAPPSDPSRRDHPVLPGGVLPAQQDLPLLPVLQHHDSRCCAERGAGLLHPPLSGSPCLPPSCPPGIALLTRFLPSPAKTKPGWAHTNIPRNASRLDPSLPVESSDTSPGPSRTDGHGRGERKSSA